ncbi:MAG: hypothetical protein JO270_06935 [Acidobacteriaceae bacterium]|nr:hypothetical protein [Acidobacteriaceae bacterium]MBV8572973.1 hypothetical protein [Acidobacteriaceae bacterium]
MKTRVAVLALMMTAGGLFIQPVSALAADFDHDQHVRVQKREDARFVREYRQPVSRRGDDRHDGKRPYRNADRRDRAHDEFRR